MKILVVSDSHGDVRTLSDILSREGGLSLVIHLGDGERDLSCLSAKTEGIPLLQVCGNCDFCSTLPDFVCTQEGGKTIFCTHGHRQMVKYGTGILQAKALTMHADIALFGHTHVPMQAYEGGMYLCNPGSVRDGNYAVLEIVAQGIFWNQKNIYPKPSL